MICKRIKLLKDLPGCPKGRYFLQDVEGGWFTEMTTDEYISGKFQHYHIENKTVINNTDWFKKCKSKKI